MKKLKFIDLFGAPGGMSLGFQMAGMESVGLLDSFRQGVETYRRNFTELAYRNIVCADASKRNIVEQFSRQTNLDKGDVDVIIGGPPCQGFSTVGRIKMASLVKDKKRSGRSSNVRFIDDERNNLYKTFVKFVNHFKPKAFVMENVPGMMNYRDGRVAEQVQEDFSRAGYHVNKPKILNAADYGVPQIRKRVFFVGRKDEGRFEWPVPSHRKQIGCHSDLLCLKPYVTVDDAISDLPKLPIGEKGVKKQDQLGKYSKSAQCEFQKWSRTGAVKLSNNLTRWHRDKDLKVFSHMKPGHKWSQLSTADKDQIGYSCTAFDDKWRRLPEDRPSWTVLSHLAKDGYMYIHPTQNRTISVREAARLQSFPDRFVFYGSRTAQFQQVGNAVPPILAMAVAECILRMINQRKGP